MVGFANAARYAPNHFLRTCLDDAWVATMEQKLQVSSTERDSSGRLVNPFLQSSLQFSRYTVEDPRLSTSNAYSDDCVPDGSFIYGVGARVDEDGKVVDKGQIDGSLILELSGWTTHSLTTTIFAILAAEVYGYDVSFYYNTKTADMTQRMSSVRSGVCTPTHVNMEVWVAGIQASLAIYMNESFTAGSVGYFGRSGLYTTHDFVVDSEEATRNSSIFFADYWKSYKYDNEMLDAISASKFFNNTKYYPPSEVGCADGSFGCQDACSRSYACTRRIEDEGKECIVVLMMYDYFDPGYLQSVMSNADIPAYFCFIGYDAVQKYAVEAQQNGTAVLFYHYQPDLFHINHPGLFDRVFLPQSIPERVVLATGTYGENGYGERTNNPVDVDFPTTTLSKYAANILYDLPIGSLVSALMISELNINNIQARYLNATKDSNEPDPTFRAACNWVKDNYEVWNMWLNRLPVCTFDAYISYTIQGCDEGSDVRTIVFQWNSPNPENESLPYTCDGGVTVLPTPLSTSRSCKWIMESESIWVRWMESKPSCDESFYGYRVTGCDSQAHRTVQYYWLLQDDANPEMSLECQGGVSLPDDVEINCEYMPHSSPAFFVFVILAIILGGLIITAMIIVYKQRAAPIVKRSQYELLELMLFGGLLICGAIVAYGGKPTLLICAIRPLLVAYGFTTIFGSLTVKSLRVYRVFLRTAMKRVTITTKMMFKVLAIFYAVDTIVFCAWYGIAFPEPKTTLEHSLEFGGDVDRITCKASGFIFTALLMFWKAILLLGGLYLSFLIRNVSSDFQESLWIFASALIVLMCCLVIAPLAYVVDMAAAVFYIFLASAFFLCTALVMAFMLVPKFFRLHEAATSSATTAAGESYQSSLRTDSEAPATGSTRQLGSRSQLSSRSNKRMPKYQVPSERRFLSMPKSSNLPPIITKQSSASVKTNDPSKKVRVQPVL